MSSKLNIILFVFFILLASGTLYAQTAGKNFITHTQSLTPVDNEEQLKNLPNKEKLETVAYYDDFGNLIQSIQKHHSPLENDMITSMQYDDFLRPVQQTSPIPKSENYGIFVPNMENETRNFYHSSNNLARSVVRDTRPYSTTVYEESSFQRVLAEYPAGEQWRDRGLKREYRFSTESDKLVKFNMASANPSITTRTLNYWKNGDLTGVEFTDENGNISREFSHPYFGKVITEVFNGLEWLRSYYVYDMYSDLRFVLTPKAMQDSRITVEELNDLCYQYNYDGFHHIMEKKLPGKGWEHFVYNTRFDIIATQDANLRVQGKWLFMKYDAHHRLIMNGILSLNSSRATLQSSIEQSNFGNWEDRNSSNTWGYSDNTFPKFSAYANNMEVWGVHFYDSYSDAKVLCQRLMPEQWAKASFPNVVRKTYLVASIVKVLGVNRYLYHVYHYDNYGRNTFTYSSNRLGGYDVLENKYDFRGKLRETNKSHYKTLTAPVLSIDYRYTYDHSERIVNMEERLNGGAWVMVEANGYNEIGELITQQNPLYTNMLSYNIRGWLLDQQNNYAQLKLRYNAPEYQATAQYNGNISSMSWNGKGYAFLYDPLNRILQANYSDEGKYNTSYKYDANGNITELTRKGEFSQGVFGLTDKLHYSYKGNQLLAVDDDINSMTSQAGFHDRGQKYHLGNSAPEYEYDANGNLKIDHNNQIRRIEYNPLNLPIEVLKQDNGSLRNMYDARGQKLRQLANWNNSLSWRDYLDGIVYSNDTLEYITTSYGRIKHSPPSGFKREYFLTDHLGNVRVVIDEQGEIKQQTSYYPFGLEIKGSNEYNREKYNRKERITEIGLGWYDYGARMYDPFIGRWSVVDPLADMFPYMSPYAAFNNNPIFWIDPTGMAPAPPDWVEKSNGDIKWDENVTSTNDKDLQAGDKYLGKNVLVGTHNRDANLNEPINSAKFELYLESNKEGPSATIMGNTVPADVKTAGTLAEGLYSARAQGRSGYLEKGKEDLALIINEGKAVPTDLGSPKSTMTQIFFHSGNNYQKSLFDSNKNPFSTGCQTSGCAPGSYSTHKNFMNVVGTGFKGSYYLRSKQNLEF